MVHQFTARIHKLGINPCVDVPEDIMAALLEAAERKSAPVQVKGTVGNAAFESNVVKYRGRHRLYLNSDVRKSAQVDVGDTVEVMLAYDPVRRMPPMPDDLRAALAAEPALKAAWRLQPGARRRAILEHFSGLKTARSKDAFMHKLIEALGDKTVAAIVKTLPDP